MFDSPCASTAKLTSVLPAIVSTFSGFVVKFAFATTVSSTGFDVTFTTWLL